MLLPTDTDKRITIGVDNGLLLRIDIQGNNIEVTTLDTESDTCIDRRDSFDMDRQARINTDMYSISTNPKKYTLNISASKRAA